MDDPAALRIRIIGPVEVTRSGIPLRLPGRQVLEVLSILAARPGRVASRDALIEALWPDDPPRDPANSLQAVVARLRAILGSTLVETVRSGYVLRVASDQVDVFEAKELVALAQRSLLAGDATRASMAFGEALSLFRGPPLADLGSPPWAHAEVASIEELRWTAIEGRGEAVLALGRHHEVVAELERLCDEAPLRERLWGQLVLALYRSGRQVEALRTYERARRALGEIGVEPGAELRGLEQAVLRQLPHIAAPDVGARLDGPPLVGRERQLTTLGRALDRALAGHGGLVLIVGEAGMGKSRLAGEIEARAVAASVAVAWGRCWGGGGEPPYWPWVQIVRALDPTVPEGDDLAELILDEPYGAQASDRRFRLFDGVARFVRMHAGEHGLVVILDDLHLADEPTVALLAFLRVALASSPVLLLATSEHAPSLDLARAALQVHLRGLDESELASLLATTLGHEPSSELTAAVHQATLGNPYLASALAAAPEKLRGDRVTAVWSTISRRLDAVPDEVREAISLASVIGGEMRVAILRESLQHPLTEVLDALDAAALAGFLQEAGVGNYVFAHSIVRDAVYASLGASRRADLHRTVGEALERLHGTDATDSAAEMAHHFLRAGAMADPARQVAYSRRAAESARSWLAFEDAVEHYRRALGVGWGESALVCRLWLGLGEAWSCLGEAEAAAEAFFQALKHAKSAGDGCLIAEAALGFAGLIEHGRSDPERVRALRDAAAALAPDTSVLRILLLARLTWELYYSTEATAPQKLAIEVVSMAQEAGSPEALAFALDARVLTLDDPAMIDERAIVIQRMVESADETGDRTAVYARMWRADVMLVHGNVVGARRAAEEAEQRARQWRAEGELWEIAALRGTLCAIAGRLGEAEELYDESRRLGTRARRSDAALGHVGGILGVRRQQGRLAELRDLLRETAGQFPAIPAWRAALAASHAAAGEEEEARNALDPLARDGFAGLPVDRWWTSALVLAAEAAALLPSAPHASAIEGFLRPFGHLHAVAGSPTMGYHGSIAHALARCALATGRTADAADACDRAITAHRAAGAPWWIEQSEALRRAASS